MKSKGKPADQETKNKLSTLAISLNILSDTVYQYLPTNPEDTGRKLNVHKTLRRRPGRLLNVLCTFNLRPVSTGKAD